MIIFIFFSLCVGFLNYEKKVNRAASFIHVHNLFTFYINFFSSQKSNRNNLQRIAIDELQINFTNNLIVDVDRTYATDQLSQTWTGVSWGCRAIFKRSFFSFDFLLFALSLFVSASAFCNFVARSHYLILMYGFRLLVTIAKCARWKAKKKTNKHLIEERKKNLKLIKNSLWQRNMI